MKTKDKVKEIDNEKYKEGKRVWTNDDLRDARNQGYKEALKDVEEIIGELKIDLEGKYRTWIGWVKVEELKQKLNGVGK